MTDVDLLVVTALPWEESALARGLGSSLERVPLGPLSLRVATDGGVGLVRCGVGPGRAAATVAALESHVRPRRVLVAGSAGGLAARLEAGALVLASEVWSTAGRTACDPDLSEQLAARLRAAEIAFVVGGLACVAAVVGTVEAKAELLDRSGALAVEMESAPLAAWAVRAGVPFAAVRVVLDGARMALPSEIATFVDETGTVSPMRLTRSLLARPGLAIDLSRLARLQQSVARRLEELARAVLRPACRAAS